MRRRTSNLVVLCVAALVAALFAVVPLASSRVKEAQPLAPGLLAHLSQGAVGRYQLSHSEAREERPATGLTTRSGAGSSAANEALTRDLFNHDQLGLPQDEETVSARSEEHTSELQSRQYLVCRLLLEKKKKK